MIFLWSQKLKRLDKNSCYVTIMMEIQRQFQAQESTEKIFNMVKARKRRNGSPANQSRTSAQKQAYMCLELRKLHKKLKNTYRDLMDFQFQFTCKLLFLLIVRTARVRLEES